MDERIIVFIDASNFWFGTKELMKRRHISLGLINYYRLARLLAHNRKIIRIFFYTALVNSKDNPTKYATQDRFLIKIREMPFCTIRAARAMRRGETYVEKGVDVMLAVDLLKLARLNSYDTAILLSGDGDFVEAVKDVQEMGKRVELAYYTFNQSMMLRAICDEFIEITETMLALSSMRTMPGELVGMGK